MRFISYAIHIQAYYNELQYPLVQLRQVPFELSLLIRMINICVAKSALAKSVILGYVYIVSDRFLLRSPNVTAQVKTASAHHSKFLFARRHHESRIEPKIVPIGVYVTMRALQKSIRYTAHHFKERTGAPQVRCRN